MIWIKRNILTLNEDCFSENEGFIRLNLNESAVDIPCSLKRKLFKRLKEVNWNRYPLENNSSLLSKLASYTNYFPEGILIGNGSNELIQTIIYACCNKGDCITTVRPGFSIYKKVAEIMGIKVIEIPVREELRFDIENILKSSKKSRLIFLGSPNNPTGSLLRCDEALKILESSSCLVVIDEAYTEFSGQTLVPLLKQYKNLLILRTFSKAFRLAGARFGYLLGDSEIVRKLKLAKLPFSVGIFQQIAVEIILEEKDFVLNGIKEIISERERLFNNFKSLKIFRPFPSKANFLLVESSLLSAEEVYQRLKQRNILVRTFNIPELKKSFRVTIGKREENNYFLKSLIQIEKEVLNGKKS